MAFSSLEICCYVVGALMLVLAAWGAMGAILFVPLVLPFFGIWWLLAHKPVKRQIRVDLGGFAHHLRDRLAQRRGGPDRSGPPGPHPGPNGRRSRPAVAADRAGHARCESRARDPRGARSVHREDLGGLGGRDQRDPVPAIRPVRDVRRARRRRSLENRSDSRTGSQGSRSTPPLACAR